MDRFEEELQYSPATDLINIVSDDVLLQKRISDYNASNSGFSLKFSTSPDFSDLRIGLYFISGYCLDSFYAEYQSRGISQPVIGYGPECFLSKIILYRFSDYLKDPWSFEEWEFRIRKNLINKSIRYNWGVLSLQPLLLCCNDKSIPLNASEFRLLLFFLNNRGIPLDRSILNRMLNPSTSEKSRIIDNHILNIRRKIRSVLPDSHQESILLTVRNKGYLMK